MLRHFCCKSKANALDLRAIYFVLFQAQLLATEQERDLALTRVKNQEEEMQSLKVYYR